MLDSKQQLYTFPYFSWHDETKMAIVMHWSRNGSLLAIVGETVDSKYVVEWVNSRSGWSN